jgi:hypothetical protein
MKPITLLFTVLLALAGFGAGLFVGRKSARSTVPAVEMNSHEVGASETPALPAVNVKPRRTATRASPTGPMSFAEMEAALLELPDLSRSKVWERLSELSKAVDPTDIPQLLTLLPRLPNDIQSSIRYSFLARWAEIDPRAAMDYANGLKNSNDRNQAITSVLRG